VHPLDSSEAYKLPPSEHGEDLAIHLQATGEHHLAYGRVTLPRKSIDDGLEPGDRCGLNPVPVLFS
jgi:hypothetical protein